MSKNLLFSLIHFLFFLPSFAFQDKNDTISLQLISLFSDHMVLQQKSDVKFWGTDKPNNEITHIHTHTDTHTHAHAHVSHTHTYRSPWR